MKISELAVEPQLVKVELDDEDIIEVYKEPLEFFVWDRQPIEKFLKFAGKQITDENLPELIAFCKSMILDEEGNPVMVENRLLPVTVMTKCISKVMQTLGK